MKKLFILSTISALMASAVCADDITASGTIQKTYNGLNFTTDGVVLSGDSNSTVNGDITVGENVMASIDSTSFMYVNGNIIGAGKDVSDLSFTGYHLSTARNGTKPYPCADITIKDITLTYTGSYGPSNTLNTNNGILRAGVTTIDNANVIFNEGKLGVHRVDDSQTASVILKNGSTLTFVDSYESNIDYGETLNYLSSAQKMFQLTDNSKLVVNGALNFRGMGIDATNSSIFINKATSVGQLKLNNSSLEIKTTAYGTSSATDGIVIASLSGENTISGTGFFRGKSSTGGSIEMGDSTLNITVAESNISIQGNVRNEKTGTLRIGSDGTKHDYNSTFYGSVQINAGRLIMGSNAVFGSDTNRNTFNLASFSNTDSVSDLLKSNVMAGAKIYASSSRIILGTFDGYISTKDVQTANGWNYSLAFGTYSTIGSTKYQKAHMILGANSQVDVNATKATYFGLFGEVEVNSQKDKLVSNANAPLMIYKDSVITLNSTDAFKVGGATSQATSDFNFYADNTNINLVVNADNNIGRFVYGSTLTEVALDIATGKVLTLGSVALASGVDEGIVALILGDDIERGMLKITDMDDILANYAGNNKIAFTDSLGSDRILGENLFLENVDGDFLVYTVAVPEPAEWAMILGALALGFVAYRRRK